MSALLELVGKLTKSADRIGSDLLIASGAIVVVFLIWGGIQYMTNPEAGKKTMIGALIGLVVVALSFWIMDTLVGVL